MRTKFAILLAITLVCAATLWGWATPTMIPYDSKYVTASRIGHDVVWGTNGYGHVVWYDYYADNVYYQRYDPASGAWSKPLQLAKQADYPVIALDANGKDIHVAWYGWKHIGSTNFHIYYQMCKVSGPGTGGWQGSPYDVDDNSLGYTNEYPALACVSGHIVISWWEFYGSYPNWQYAIGFRELTASGWTKQLQFDAGSAGKCFPAVCVTSGGDVAFTYGGQDALGYYHIYVYRRVGGSWDATPEDVTKDFPNSASDWTNFYYGDIDAAPAGPVHVLYHAGHRMIGVGGDTTVNWLIYHSYSATQGTWSQVTQVPGSGFADFQPNMVIDGDGAIHAVWHGSADNPTTRGIRYASWTALSGWSPLTWVTSTPDNTYSDQCPSIGFAQDAGGNRSLHVFWSRAVGPAPYKMSIWISDSSGSGFNGLAEEKSGQTAPARFALSPNPVKAGVVNVQYAVPRNEPLRVVLLDVSGRAVETREIPATGRSGSFSIDVRSLSAGVYVARLTGRGLTVSKALVVE